MSGPPVRRSLDMVGNAHLDAVWLWPWQEGYAEVRATIRSALDRLRGQGHGRRCLPFTDEGDEIGGVHQIAA